MKPNLPPSSAINRVFAALFLLTRSSEGAEKAMLEGIASIQPDGVTNCEQLLLRASAAAALALEEQTLPSPETWSGMVPGYAPEEMQGVLRLPRGLRFCFVLRILLALSAEQCAALLNLTIERINADVGLAIQRLVIDENVRREPVFPLSNHVPVLANNF